MNITEFEEYLNLESHIYDKFYEKAFEFQQNLNADRQPAKRYPIERVETETEKMWSQMLENMYNNLKAEIEKQGKSTSNQWQEYIEERSLFDTFEESISDIEFAEA